MFSKSIFCMQSLRTVLNTQYKTYHQTTVLNKKIGIFSDLSNKSANSDEVEHKKVKLYPGFQSSVEDFNQASHTDRNSQQNLTAKQVIEDFYGLNELEYDQTGIKSNETNIKDLTSEESTEFDLESVVKALKSQNVRDICCIEIPDEMIYANHMIIGSCLSEKHLNSTFIGINKKYKLLKKENSPFLRRKLSQESKWCALDTGNMIIHLFLPDARQFYDLETLWTFGAEFDQKCISFAREQYDIEKKLIVVEE